MKLSRTTWITLAVGIFIVAAIFLYMLYQGEVKKQKEAQGSLARAQLEVPVLISQKQALDVKLSGLKGELAQWQSQIAQLQVELSQALEALNRTEDSFPGLVESIEYDEALFSFARANDLKIVSIGASEPAEKNVEGITYSTTSFTVQVQGKVADILDFVNTIVSDADFQTAIMEPVSITIPKPLTETEKENMTEEEIAEIETPSATITLVIYNYQGEQNG